MYLNPSKIGAVHFVGIGGIGMSGLAEILLSLGFEVQGSDLSDNANVQRLRTKGIPVFIGQKAGNIDGAKVVVISSAVKPDNLEVCAARQKGIPVLRRVEMLSEIMRLKPAIAVAGTHGKTTTTSLGATVLRSAGLDPTIISGGIITALGTNAILGTGDWTIAEADESDGTFEKLPAQIAIVTNIDPEHLDHYGSYENLKHAFAHYLQNIPFYGLAILCADHPETLKISKEITDRRVLTYGFSDTADIRAVDLTQSGQGQSFSLAFSKHARDMLANSALDDGVMTGFLLPMSGKHNLQNALAVIAASLEVGLTPAQIKLGLCSFSGVKRRFTHVGHLSGVEIIDDYAHHPTEIAATLSAAREVCSGKVIAVVQPHRYSRLKSLFADFVSVLSRVDGLVLLPVYAAGEVPDSEFDHHKLKDDLEKTGCQVCVIDNLEALRAYIEENGVTGDMAVFMGAGDITYWARDMVPEQSKVTSTAKGVRRQSVKQERC